MIWREVTPPDTAGEGNYRYLIDIIPDTVPHQVGSDDTALVRIGRHGWAWSIFDMQENEWIGDVEYTHTREEAIGAVMSKLAELRS